MSKKIYKGPKGVRLCLNDNELGREALVEFNGSRYTFNDAWEFVPPIVNHWLNQFDEIVTEFLIDE